MRKKIAIVTGAGQGIGRAIALALAKQGTVPVIADINGETAHKVADELKTMGVPGMSQSVDVSDVEAVTQMVRAVVEKFDTIDILVNNAGILHATPIEDITEQEWDRMMAVNLKSVFFASQQVLPYMKAQRWGRIINMSSLAGRMGGYGNGVGYAATKAGIIGLTMSMARRVAPFDITVNSVAPGTTESAILQSFSAERIRELQGMVPLGRLGKPEDIAALCAFLASEEAGFITGAVIDINGGMFMG
ncbi:MAG: 3-oxoacyl-ACP reductase FabG [Desulfobacterales bacterium]|nr:MAG: 3-oxoacyl-ACP reductase FabG [Desulfobacterales bacterium]